MLRKLFLILPMLLIIGSVAQADDTFNPDNPPEPQAKYRLIVSATPEGVASVSGKGSYKEGTRVYVNTSSTNIDYAFKHWLKDGEIYSTSRSFYYTMGRTDVHFVAVYEFVVFDPTSPADPGGSYKWRLFINSDPPEAASFNINSGTKFEQGTSVELNTYANQGFEFLGWYDENEALVSSTKKFTLTMPSASSTLTARYIFNPDSPADPIGDPNQNNIDNFLMGDVNVDRIVDIADVQRLLNVIIGVATGPNSDVNNDRTIDIADVQRVLNIIIGK